MNLPDLSPMFDSRVSPFGVPAQLLVLGVAFVGLVISFAVIRRVTTYSDDSHAFRATNRRGSLVDRALVGTAVLSAGLLVALVAASLLLRR